MTKEVGTLREIGARVGDVVELMTKGTFRGEGSTYIIKDNVHGETWAEHEDGGIVTIQEEKWEFKIIRRAASPFNTLTAEEKGALLLANLEGKIIEMSIDGGETWERSYTPQWIGAACYLVKEDEVKEVTVYGIVVADNGEFGARRNSADTHRITFNLVNGKPDCASVKMEDIQ